MSLGGVLCEEEVGGAPHSQHAVDERDVAKLSGCCKYRHLLDYVVAAAAAVTGRVLGLSGLIPYHD